MRSAEDAYSDLLAGLRALGAAVVAFSGGVDSTLLLVAAREALGEAVLAVTLAPPYAPAAEIADAKRTAAALGVRHILLELPFPEALRDNPPQRCYLCKRTLFTELLRVAAEQGIDHVLDGTNVDDQSDYRPGRKALAELGIESPLLDAGLTKAMLRELLRERGQQWDKPSGACLLSRLPHGTHVDEAVLRRIDQAENILRELGFPAVRVRSHGDLARIEVPREMVAAVVEAERVHGIAARLTALGYRHVTVDLAGYRMGSLNEPSGQ